MTEEQEAGLWRGLSPGSDPVRRDDSMEAWRAVEIPRDEQEPNLWLVLHSPATRIASARPRPLARPNPAPNEKSTSAFGSIPPLPSVHWHPPNCGVRLCWPETTASRAWLSLFPPTSSRASERGPASGPGCSGVTPSRRNSSLLSYRRVICRGWRGPFGELNIRGGPDRLRGP
jgi:hypothetical protein